MTAPKHTATRALYVQTDAQSGASTVHEAPLDGESIHGPSIAWFATEEDARLYVRAVNSHAALARALRDVVLHIDWYLAATAGPVSENLSRARSKTRAALRLAGEE